MTTGVNGTLSTIENEFYTIIWQPMLKAGEAWIEGQVPFLALPVVKQVDEAIIGVLTDALYKQVVMLVDVTYIRLVDPARQALYATASEQLAIISQEQGVNSDAYKQALIAAAAAQSSFTKFNGS